MFRPRIQTACLAVSLGCVAAGARAETEPEPVRIEFDAPDACGDRETFLQRVRERTDRFTLAPPDAPARRFSIQILDVKERFSGVLTIESPGAARQQREIASHSCSDVVDALAFFTALAIDPKLSTSTEAPEPAPETPPPAEPLPALPIPPTEPLPPPRRTERSWRFGAGAHFTAVSGIAPELLLGGEAFLDLTLLPGRLLSPALRAGARIVRNANVEVEQNTAAFELATLWLEACPLWAGSSELGLRLCGAGEIGRLTAEGLVLVNPQHAERDWGALAVTLRPTVILVDRILLEASLGALFPLRRDSFSFAGQTFHEVETVTFVLAAGVTGWAF